MLNKIKYFFKNKKNPIALINSKKLDNNGNYMLYNSIDDLKKETKFFYGLSFLSTYNISYLGYSFYEGFFSLENNLDSIIIGFTTLSLLLFKIYRNNKTIAYLELNTKNQMANFGIKNNFNNKLNNYEIKISDFEGIKYKNGLFKIGVLEINHNNFNNILFKPKYIDDEYLFKEIAKGTIIETDKGYRVEVNNRNLKKYNIFK